MLLRNSHHRTRSRLSTATVAGKTLAIVVPCRRPGKKGTGVGASCPGGEEADGPCAQPPVVDPLAAAVAFVRSQAWPAGEFPAPVTDPVPDAFVDATEPAAVTWFTLSGNQPALPAGSYTGIQATDLLNTLVSGPYLWIAFGSLLVCVAAAIAIAGFGERTRHFGTFGIIVLLLYAALLYIAAYQYNQQAPAGDGAISIGYGLIVAVVACVLIEAGARLPGGGAPRPPLPPLGAGR